ncbi:MAG: transglutaminase-like domain-containing protein [Candidatus Pacearchaeota archaeon]|jgi:hypothetical protein
MRNNNSIARRTFLGLCGAGALSSLVGSSTSCSRSKAYTLKEPNQDELRESVLMYLAQPKFSGKGFMRQISGTDAELRLFDLPEKMLYFSIPNRVLNQGNFEETMAKLTLNLQGVRFGKTDADKFFGGIGDPVSLDGYVLNVPETFFFGFPSGDFRIDPKGVISVPFPSANYNLSLKELYNFLDNASIYGGNLVFNSGRNERGLVAGANHGAFVARKGEPSLERFVRSLTDGILSGEEKAQRVLDFVTGEVAYDHSESGSGTEVLKRPNEVLMTGGSDCSGKTILLASLLEQTGVNYLILYLADRKHITTAVEGNFRNENGLSFKINGKVYHAAEATTPHFRIGETVVDTPWSSKDITGFQRPGSDARVYSARTGEAL